MIFHLGTAEGSGFKIQLDDVSSAMKYVAAPINVPGVFQNLSHCLLLFNFTL